jgi:hypothetical protein
MKAVIAFGGVALVLFAPFTLPGMAQECHLGCARTASVEACVRCSLGSERAKRMGYSESGIRRWCQQNQPACNPANKKVKKN